MAVDAPFLDLLAPVDASTLRDLGARRRYPVGATLFFEGDPAHDVVVIERGDVSILVTSPEGREVVIDVAGPGALLGELSAIDGGSRSASAVALNDVEILAVPIARFADYLDEHAAVQRTLLHLLAGRLRGANRRQLEFGTVDALGRVCSRIIELSTRFGQPRGDAIVIDSPINQTDLGNWAGLSREAVVKALRSLRVLGWIDTNRNTIVIRDLAAIRARSGSIT